MTKKKPQYDDYDMEKLTKHIDHDVAGLADNALAFVHDLREAGFRASCDQVGAMQLDGGTAVSGILTLTFRWDVPPTDQAPKTGWPEDGQ